MRLSLTEHASIGQENIPVFDLLLQIFIRYRRPVDFLYEVAFAKDLSHEYEPAGGDQTLVAELYMYCFYSSTSMYGLIYPLYRMVRYNASKEQYFAPPIGLGIRNMSSSSEEV